MKNSMVKNTLILTLITLCAGLFLGFVYEITKEPIAIAQEQVKEEAYQEVFAAADGFEAYEDFDEAFAEEILIAAGFVDDSITEIVVAMDGDQVLGHVITVTAHDGYAGDISFTVGITLEGTINGVAVLSISETAGLGMKAADESFTSQFTNTVVQAFSVTKTGATDDSEINAISGATITTSAMVNGVNAGIAYWEYITGGEINE